MTPRSRRLLVAAVVLVLVGLFLVAGWARAASLPVCLPPSPPCTASLLVREAVADLLSRGGFLIVLGVGPAFVALVRRRRAP